MGTFRACLLACVIASPALADPPTEQQKAQAKDLVNKAKDKSTAGDHQAAADLYLQAYNIAPLPLLLSNAASEYEQLHKSVEALKYYCEYLKAEPDGPMASYATSHAKELQVQMKNPVDESNVCAPPKQAPPPTPPTPPDHHEEIMQQPPPVIGGTTQHDDPGKGMKLAGLGVAGLGVAGLAVGIVYGIKAKNISDSITNHDVNMKWDDSINQDEADGKHDQTLQITFLIAGGALFATGAVIYVLGRNKAPEEHVAVRPVVAPGYGGLAVGGHF